MTADSWWWGITSSHLEVSGEFYFFPPSVYSWQVVHKTFYWHNSFCGSTFAARDRLRFLIISLRVSLQDLVSHSFEQDPAPMACLRTRSGSLVATRQYSKEPSGSKVIHLNVQGGPSHSQTPPLHHLQQLGQTSSERKRRIAEALWTADVRKENASKVIPDESWGLQFALELETEMFSQSSDTQWPVKSEVYWD